jgi:electron transfer flavoprotein alpha subunit
MGTAFWTWMHVTGDTLDETAGGLLAEARRLAGQAGGASVRVVAMGAEETPALARLGGFGAEQVLFLKDERLEMYHGELFAHLLAGLIAERQPRAVLFSHSPQSADLVGRLGALCETGAVTRVMDVMLTADGGLRAVRPIANGYLSETVSLDTPAALLSFLPSVLADPEPVPSPDIPVDVIEPPFEIEALRTQTVEIIDADPEKLDIEEADIVVAGGRGVGSGEDFDIIHRLARVLGGSVAGTRPVIDWHTLPFERQIGQTGKSVSPRLIVNCGISGANEYTAGIEKAQQVIAINADPRARIFRFADLGIVGDLHAVLPLLVERLEQTMNQSEA